MTKTTRIVCLCILGAVGTLGGVSIHSLLLGLQKCNPCEERSKLRRKGSYGVKKGNNPPIVPFFIV